MPVDKSLFHYGSLYHKLFDPSSQEVRENVVGLVKEGSTVLDIGCGTGQLCAALAEEKGCRVVGLDLSLRMLKFARKTHSNPALTFLHGDATDLSEFVDRSFDYACVVFLLHELEQTERMRVLAEALRVAKSLIIVDMRSPLPENAAGRSIRFVEATFERASHKSFLDYLARNGTTGLLDASPSPLEIERERMLGLDCLHLVMLSQVQ